MIYPLIKPISFEQFIDWYPESAPVSYELRNGVMIEMPKPRGEHSQIAGMLAFKLMTEIEHRALPFFIPKECIIQINEDTGYEPDVVLLNRASLADELLWHKASAVALAGSIPLVIEVVSTNWQDDYLTKLRDYETLGIPEYWIVDYLGLGAKRYTGSPKQPTLTLYTLLEGEYQAAVFRGDTQIQSPTFPGLQLSANQIFAA